METHCLNKYMGKRIKLKNNIYLDSSSIVRILEDEHETGEEYNGKRVYSKTFDCGAMSGDTLNVSHGISFYDIWIDQANSYMIAPDGAVGPLPFLNSHLLNYCVECFLSDNGNTIHLYSVAQRISKAIVTLKYTKA